ncbi:cytochrome c biogenesis protein [Allomuricauda sp. SCSIO 65647]|uniref:cytochrome c biogenesis protein n=1 Tax=Allomuricauda sp. SCSIO 65647 TaxID=2908843 RepID=UPI001F4567A9|nr:cytochrome c biogenesis protein CcsA [Muricauda sp. SCSIO 65647]UJH66643.1 cytochrome c biogenesis protein CcsA [Muricauda sp. SCSIO 65647]
MKKVFDAILKPLSPFFNTKAAAVYLLVFAASIGVATFIENDYGTSAAQKMVYQAWWFELLLLLFGITVIANIRKFRMIQQKKWALLIIHIGIIVILIGAALTRYMGYEGMMHIRENDSSSSFLSSNNYLKFHVKKAGKDFYFDDPVLFASLGNNRWEQSYLLDEDLIKAKVTRFVPNPRRVLGEADDGKPTLQVVTSGPNGREDHFIAQDKTERIGNMLFNFGDSLLARAINIRYHQDALMIKPIMALTQTNMTTHQRDTLLPNRFSPLLLNVLYSDGFNTFVFSDFKKKGQLQIESEDSKVKNESIVALALDIAVNDEIKKTYIYGKKGNPGGSKTLAFNDMVLSVSYGAKEMAVPFSIRLNDFIMDKYPGTNSASSYASEVTLIDTENDVALDYRIYMNNILNYGGHRFFQSSFDTDEKGTYLSVNSDFWGTLISYIGYALLTLGMVMALFSKKTRFHQVSQKIKKIRANRSALALLALLVSFIGNTQPTENTEYAAHAVQVSHAEQFSRLIVQDFKGRMKPVHTLSREVFRKVARKESMFGLTADQLLLSLFADKETWQKAPLVKLGKHEDLREKLKLQNEHAAYADFFDGNGKYILLDEVREAYALEPADRGVYEKELLKVDERVNVLRMAFSGRLLKLVPVPNDPNNIWVSITAHVHGPDDVHGSSDSITDMFDAYGNTLKEAMATGNYINADLVLDKLYAYQQEHGGEIIPSKSKVKAEIALNESKVFTRLAVFYILLGILLLGLLFVSVFKPSLNLKGIYKLLLLLILLGFLSHTIGLVLRWYVSERAPWSNGYESMIYIAWTATLAGLIFTRKSLGGLAATTVLAAIILFVATLSFLDPEITPLVPVLKSYWLTIHVSLVAGSYGFLMLGAIIGLINLALMTFMRESNADRVKRIVKEMSYVSELTLIGGLFMLSVGTYLGGIWANESWGRYWGWDAKETWALVTILIYAFILHMRLIPKFRGLFAYNLASIFGLASVIMTYYGVNYYLSGLHSYASGDPVPIPNWVYIVVFSIFVISSLAFFKNRKDPIKY